MKTRTFLGKLLVRTGEYENSVTLLLVAPSFGAAEALLELSAKGYYGDEDDDNEPCAGGYYSNHDTVHVSAGTPVEIGLATFLDLKAHFMVRAANNVQMPTPDDLLEVNTAAKALHSALQRKHMDCSHSEVLNAMASAFGDKNWPLLKAKLEAAKTAPAPLCSETQLTALVAAAREVVSQADDAGCDGDLTVTSKSAVKSLDDALDAFKGLTAVYEPATPEFDEDIVVELVDDVRRRARRHQFSIDSMRRAIDLASDSNDLLNLDASPQDLNEAARRLA